MKKLLALLLVLVLAFSIVACGSTTGSNGNDDKDDDKSKKEEKKEKDDEEDGDGENQEGFSRGKIENNVYKNSFLGFEIKMSDSWKIGTDEDIARICGVTVDEIKGEGYKNLLEQFGSMAEFTASTNDTKLSATITYIYPKTYPLVSSGENATAEEFAGVYTKMFESSGGKTESKTVTLSGDEYYRTNIVFEGSELAKVYYFRRVGDYMCVMEFVYGNEYTLDSIEALIK